MRILITGKGGAASWVIRGEQLGHAIGATVKPQASKADMDAHDLVIVVKKWTPQMERDLWATKTPILWDIVDGWPQGRGSFEQARQHISNAFTRIGAAGAVFATQSQRVDLWFPGFVLRHHARPDQEVNPIREHVRSVCYEGSPRYLEKWAVSLIQAKGWRFEVNPKSIADHDIVIATRGNGYGDDAAKRWKSNVKLANAQATGTPCILPCECGYLESDRFGPIYYKTRDEFARALDELEDRGERKRRAMMLRGATPRLQDIAARYRACIAKFYGSLPECDIPARPSHSCAS